MVTLTLAPHLSANNSAKKQQIPPGYTKMGDGAGGRLQQHLSRAEPPSTVKREHETQVWGESPQPPMNQTENLRSHAALRFSL